MPKNIAAFILACIVIWMSWFWRQNLLWPPRRPDQQAAKLEQAKKEQAKKDQEKKEAEKKDDEKKEAKPPMVAEAKKEEKKPAAEKKPQAEPEPAPQTYRLGSPKTHLQVLLTSKGAGVQQVILTRFKAADYLGKPADRELELI